MTIDRFRTAWAAFVLNGGAGNDSLAGGTLADTLSGLEGNDTIVGGDGNDVIDGGIGADTMTGGLGDDIFIIDDAGDRVFEATDGGNDLIRSSVSFNLTGQYVERLTLTGTAAINATGNGLANILIGNAAANTLNGGAGADTMSGGVGDDSYVVDDIGDKVIEDSATGGIDTVRSAVTFSLLGQYIENLILTGTIAIDGAGNGQANALTGNAAANTLDGGAGADTLTGGAGNDIYVVDNVGDRVIELAGGGTDTVRSTISWTLAAEFENLTLTGSAAISATGNALANILIGNAAGNLLDGGAGADTMDGGAGNDSYVVDNVGDRVIEASATGGVDIVRSSVSFSLAGQYLENLTLTGTAAINATGNGQANALTGNAAANSLNGGAGNDTLDGGAGADTMTGGDGDDLFIVDNIADKVIESSATGGVDTVRASVTFSLANQYIENLILTGAAAINGTGNNLANSLTGNDAANLLDGGTGTDRLAGGLGSDVYIVDNAGDVVVEGSNAGTDTVRSSIGWTLGANLENLMLLGTAAINGSGNALNNVLAGNDAANILDGGAGADTMAGGLGNDTYVVDNVGDLVTESSATGGTDLVKSSVSVALGANLENLTLTGTGAINATGNGIANILTGNDGANVLDGGAGADTMSGGLGNDIYVVDNIGDRVIEASATGGTDLVKSSVSFSLVGQYIEYLTLVGSAAINAAGNGSANRIIGNAAANVLDGGAGADTLDGGLGDDTYLIDNVGDKIVESANGGIDTVHSSIGYSLAGQNLENLTLTGGAEINATGNALANVLIGNASANTLDGGAGADTMDGGSGNDIFIVDNVGDKVIESSATGGTDLVKSSVSFSLVGQNVEYLTLTGSAAINGTGNALANRIIGNAAANVLDGGAGADTLDGGLGNDSYVIDNVGDKIVEGATGGTDSVRSSISYSLAGQYLENLTLTGTAAINATGNTGANSLIGNAAANTLDGGAGADTMDGGAGNDVYIVDNAGDRVVEASATGGTDLVKSSVSFSLAGQYIENLTLTGTAAINATGNGSANILTGNAAANTLDGAGGADTMDGGAGNDIYVVDNANDRVTETSATGGIDLVKSAVSFALGANLENLGLTGTAAINGTGNTLANSLTGNSGANTLDGGAGADTMDGGSGDDSYVVDDALDKVIESSAAGGTDTVRSSVAWTLGDNVENLTLTGTAAIAGVGNMLANTIIGNAAANRIAGGLGMDVLTGGAGADKFQFDTLLGTANVDRITDFSVVDDTITLNRTVFGALSDGVLSASAFRIGIAALDADDRIVYNSTTGALLYDADGNGSRAAVQFATLATGLALTAADFQVYFENRAPTIVKPIADIGVNRAELWSFTLPAGSFVDLDGQAITYQATLANGAALPSWLSFDAATQRFSGYVPANFSGGFDVRVTASDGTATTSDVFRISQQSEFRYQLSGDAWGIPDFDFRYDDFYVSVDQSTSTSFGDGTFGGSLGVYANERAGLLLDIHAGTPKYALDYAFDVQQQTSTLADVIDKKPWIIANAVATGPAWLETTAADDFTLDLFVGAQASAGVFGEVHLDIDVIDGGASFNLPILSTGNTAAVDVSLSLADVIAGLPQTDISYEGAFGSLTAALPEMVSVSGALGDAVHGVRPLTGSETTNAILTADLDIDEMIRLALNASGIPVPEEAFHGKVPLYEFNAGLAEAGIGLSYTTLGLDLIGDIAFKESYDFQPEVNVVARSSFGEVLTGKGGDKLEFTTPEGEGQFTVTSTYTTTATLTTTLALHFNAHFDAVLMSAALSAWAYVGAPDPLPTVVDEEWDLPGFAVLDESLDLINFDLPIKTIVRHFSQPNVVTDTTVIDYEKFRSVAGSGDNFTFTTHQIFATGNDRVNALTGNALDNVIDGAGGNDVLSGLGGHDTLNGDAGNDTLNGGEGNNILNGGDGNDKITAGGGDDVIHGGAGVDTIDAGAGNNRIYAEGGDETITAGLGNDIIDGGDGNDVLNGGAGSNNLFGGAGNDQLNAGSGGDILDGGAGDDTIVAGDGDNLLTGGDGIDSITAGAGKDTVDGGDGADTLALGAGDNNARGGAGADRITTTSGIDELYGNLGDDVIDAGAGNDRIYGGAGRDRIIGGKGDDFLSGDYGGGDPLPSEDADDFIFSETTDPIQGDTFVFRPGDGNDVIEAFNTRQTFDGEAIHEDRIDLSAYTAIRSVLDLDIVQTGPNSYKITLSPTDSMTFSTGVLAVIDNRSFIFASDGPETLTGTSGNDRLDGGGGADTMTGRAGDDTYIVDNAGDRVIERAGEGNDTVHTSTNWTLGAGQSVEHIIAFPFLGIPLGDASTRGIDITGNELGNHIVGQEAINHLYGMGGNDIIESGNVYWTNVTAGADLIDGGDGNDRLIAGRASGDTVLGGAGDDVIVLNGAAFVDGGTGTDTIETNAVALNFSSGYLADCVSIERWVWADTSEINSANWITGGSANDWFETGTGMDQVNGEGGDDRLYGGSGDDTLSGGSGRDLLVGGSGNDTMSGGSDADRFGFTWTSTDANSTDTITDFQIGVDKLDLSMIEGFDLTLDTDGDGVLARGQFGIFTSNVPGATVVAVNLDNDVAAELLIVLKNVSASAMTIGDFVL